MRGAPGFLAERSAYRNQGRYGGVYRGEGGGLHGVAVRTSLVDSACMDACVGNCAQDCADLGGSARGLCLRMCRQEAESCLQTCTVDPGPGGGGTGPSSPACAPGAPCFSSRTGASCPCPPGEVCRRRCGPPICEVNALLCFLFPPFGCLPQCSPGLCSTESFCQPA
jgi:hypothetical protein